MSIGDITSDTKGSGARFNSGKPPLELIPLTCIAQQMRALHYTADTFAVLPAAEALHHLGRWQARQTGLVEVLNALGAAGWEECARVFDYGRRKYKEWNWAKGMPWSVPLACAARHLLAMMRGEENDPESGLPHRGHVFCNIVMLMTFATTFVEGDDRAPVGLLSNANVQHD